MLPSPLRIGVRDNRLGRILGQEVAGLLKPHLGTTPVTVVPVEDARDRARAGRWPGAALERALLDDIVDLAVQNLKDVGPESAPGLILAAVTERATPFDVLIARDGTIVDELPEGSAISAHTPLRRAQLLRYRDDLAIVDFAGSLDDRIRMLEMGEVDGLVVSAAAVEHLGYQDRVTEVFTTEVLIPAPGQGALGLQARKTQRDVIRMAKHLDDPVARAEIAAERAFQRELRSTLPIAVGALAKLDGSDLMLEGVVADRDGAQYFRDVETGRAGDEEQVGVRLARRLLLDGARALLIDVAQGAR